MPSTKSNTVMAVFQTRAAAEEAILELQRAGFADQAIGMVAHDERGEVITERPGETMAEEGLAAGAVVGAGAGRSWAWGSWPVRSRLSARSWPSGHSGPFS